MISFKALAAAVLLSATAATPAFAHNKADCGATGRRDEIMPREHGGDSTPEGSSIPRAARLNQSDIVFIFSIRLEPTKTLQGSG